MKLGIKTFVIHYTRIIHRIDRIQQFFVFINGCDIYICLYKQYVYYTNSDNLISTALVFRTIDMSVSIAIQ